MILPSALQVAISRFTYSADTFGEIHSGVNCHLLPGPGPGPGRGSASLAPPQDGHCTDWPVGTVDPLPFPQSSHTVARLVTAGPLAGGQDSAWVAHIWPEKTDCRSFGQGGRILPDGIPVAAHIARPSGVDSRIAGSIRSDY
jgi:hypothetical protein